MPQKSDFTPEQWAGTPEPIKARILAGQPVSGINEKGGDDTVWDLDDAEELRLAHAAMTDLRVRAAARDADVPLP